MSDPIIVGRLLVGGNLMFARMTVTLNSSCWKNTSSRKVFIREFWEMEVFVVRDFHGT